MIRRTWNGTRGRRHLLLFALVVGTNVANRVSYPVACFLNHHAGTVLARRGGVR